MVAELDGAARPSTWPASSCSSKALRWSSAHACAGPSRRGTAGRRRRRPAVPSCPVASASCSAAKRLMPLSSSTTISPSMMASRHGSLREGRRQVAVALRPVEAAAGDQPRCAIADMGHRAVAVELDLVQPAWLCGRPVPDGGRELRLDPHRHGRAARRRRALPGLRSPGLAGGCFDGAASSSIRRPDFTLSGRAARMSARRRRPGRAP